MSKINEAFQNKKAFIGFLTAGDPTLEKTEEFIIEMEKAGAALIQIGIPFSDPIAEGPVIQDANVRALSVPGGCTTDMVFDMVKRVSKKVSVPLVFFTYLNPVYKYGYEKFCARCNETGISGLIIPDMPFEERVELTPTAEKYNVELISLIAPTSEDRVQMIAKEAKGYIYVVPSMDITGEPDEKTTDIEKVVENIKKVTDTPVAIGFGANDFEQAAKYSRLADGIIVASAIVKIIAENGNNAGKYVYEYVKSMARGMEN